MEQQDISLSYGIRRSPSIGNEGELSECVNLIPRNGELVNIQPPKELGIILPEGSTLMYTHRTKDFLHYIFFQTNVLRYADTDGTIHLAGGNQYDKIPKSVTSIGNTLVVVTDKPIRYLLWQDGFYKELGEKPPFPILSFGLVGHFVSSDTITMGNPDDVDEDHPMSITRDNLSYINNEVMGAASKFIREESVNKGRFMFPFFIRYAYRLYDGSTFMHSAPILMIPSSDVSPHAMFRVDDDKEHYRYTMAAIACSIDYRISGMGNQKSYWKDIVKSLDIYITAPQYTFDYYGEITGAEYIEEDLGFGVYKIAGGYYNRLTFYEGMSQALGGTPTYKMQFVLPGNAVDDSLPENSLFYKIASVTYKDLCAKDEGSRESLLLEDNLLEALQNREQLVDADGYQNLDMLISTYTYNYNQRLNIANIKRILFDGYPPESMVAYNDGSSTISVKVFIREGDKEIVSEVSSLINLGINTYYLYYPNPNAYKMVITRGSDGYQVIVSLTPHNTLNGSFYFNSYAPLIFKPGADNTQVSTDKSVETPNKIYTSEVNNPFYFPLDGINTVGTGEIIGIRSTTKALSQGQFGQYPLYAFSSDGIWALQVSDTGLYSSIQPVSRDICNNPESITQLDSSIAFSTEIGLKIIQGSDIRLLSSSLEGPNIDEAGYDVNPGFSDLFVSDTETFVETLRSCKMAYDYTSSLIHIYPENNGKHYVYSLDSGEFSTYVGEIVSAVAEDYPNTVIQARNKLYSLERYVSGDIRRGMVITRPIALGDPFSLKNIIDIRTLGQKTNEETKIRIAIFVSEDRKRWSRLKSLRQRSFKFYRFVYFTSLTDLDTLSGTRVIFETRRDGKLR